MGRSSEAEHGVIVANQWYDDWIKDIPDLSDKVAIVTGSNSGTGFWAANALASKNCTVVLACRSLDKAKHAQNDIRTNYPQAKLDIIQLDNMDLQSVRDFAATFLGKYDRLDYLLNNAGIMAQPLIKSKDGFDIQFQTNHLSHFLLTKLLWDKLVKTPGQSRVVLHSSGVHHVFLPIFDRNHLDNPRYSYGFLGINWFMVKFVFPIIMGFVPMDNWLRYAVSKLANILMMRQLQHYIENQDLTQKVISVACHPGYANTGLQAGAADSMKYWKFFNRMSSQSAADGSLPLLYATVGANIYNGDYVGPSMSGELKGPPTKVSVKGHGNDTDMAKSLWDFSEECIGEKFLTG